MTKEVWVTVKGLQFVDNEQQDPVEVITAGEYYSRAGKHFVLYEELTEGSDQATQNRIKISPEAVEITKTGIASAKMIFEKGKTHYTDYATPFGVLNVGFHAYEIEIDQEEDVMEIQLHYGLEMDGQNIADCDLSIIISSKSAGMISL